MQCAQHDAFYFEFWCIMYDNTWNLFFSCIFSVVFPHSSHFKRQSTSVVTYFYYTNCAREVCALFLSHMILLSKYVCVCVAIGIGSKISCKIQALSNFSGTFWAASINSSFVSKWKKNSNFIRNNWFICSHWILFNLFWFHIDPVLQFTIDLDGKKRINLYCVFLSNGRCCFNIDYK